MTFSVRVFDEDGVPCFDSLYFAPTRLKLYNTIKPNCEEPTWRPIEAMAGQLLRRDCTAAGGRRAEGGDHRALPAVRLRRAA